MNWFYELYRYFLIRESFKLRFSFYMLSCGNEVIKRSYYFVRIRDSCEIWDDEEDEDDDGDG